MLRFVLLTSIGFITQSLWAYPKAVYKGYHSCQTCHVAANGGGTLNDYGRAMQESFMTSFAREGEAQEFSPFGEVEWLDYSLRWSRVHLESKQGDFELKRTFNMRTELELALHLDDRLTLVSGAGYYGDKVTPEYRRSYLAYKYNKNWSFRAGKFAVPYGLNIDDHTSFIKRRLGLDQGREQWASELSFRWKRGEVFVNYFAGTSMLLQGSEEGRFKLEDKSQAGGSVRAAYYLAKEMQLGASLRQSPDRDTAGIFFSASPFKDAYLLAEYDWDKLGEQQSVLYLKGGYFIMNGLDSYLVLEQSSRSERRNRYQLGLDWAIRPRVQIRGAISQSTLDDKKESESGLAMLQLSL